MRAAKSHLNTRNIRSRAFTLIELLTVIVIIGILAGLTLGVAGIASRKSKVSRTRAELARLDLAIRNYKAHFGFYPPDNVIKPEDLTQNPVVNQLYYELSGAVLTTDNKYRANGDTTTNEISRLVYRSAFGSTNLAGIYNSSASAANTKNFLQGNRASQAQLISLPGYQGMVNFSYKALTVPVPWPLDHWKTQGNPSDPEFDARFFPPLRPFATDRETLRINPWHYNSTNPTNNPGEFDLWADIVLGNEFITVGNWKED